MSLSVDPTICLTCTNGRLEALQRVHSVAQRQNENVKERGSRAAVTHHSEVQAATEVRLGSTAGQQREQVGVHKPCRDADRCSNETSCWPAGSIAKRSVVLLLLPVDRDQITKSLICMQSSDASFGQHEHFVMATLLCCGFSSEMSVQSHPQPFETWMIYVNSFDELIRK